MTLSEHGVSITTKFHLIIVLFLIIFTLIKSSVDATIMTSRIITNEGIISYPIPEPDTPYKWYGINVAFHNQFRSEEEWMNLIDTLHPKVIYFSSSGDWWEYKYWPDGYFRYEEYIERLNNLLGVAKEKGVLVIAGFGNCYAKEIGIGTDGWGIDPTTGQPFLMEYHENEWNYRWHVENCLKSLTNGYPIYFILQSEWTASMVDNSIPENYERNEQDLLALNSICESYGVKLGLYEFYRGGWWMDEFINDYAFFTSGGGYPAPDSGLPGQYIPAPGVYPTLVGFKCGTLSTSVYDPECLWTAEAVKNIFDAAEEKYFSKTTVGALLMLGIPNENLIDPMICPEFASAAVNEATTRGYITNLPS